MKMLRKSLAFPVVLLCLLTAAGAAPLRIVTSFYPVYIATLNVAKDVPGVEVVNLTPPLTGCLHDYQMTAGRLEEAVRRVRVRRQRRGHGVVSRRSDPPVARPEDHQRQRGDRAARG